MKNLNLDILAALNFITKVFCEHSFYKYIRHERFVSFRVSLLAQMAKNLPAKQEIGSIPGLGRHPPREGNGNPLQYPCLENPMDRGAWQATVHGVSKSQTRLSK